MNRTLPAFWALCAGLPLGAWADEPPRPDEPRWVLGDRAASAEGRRAGLGYTTGSAVEVSQPRPDTVAVLMTGVVAAGGLPLEPSEAEIVFEMRQKLRLEARPGQRLRLVFEARSAGLLRGNRDGDGAVTAGPAEAVLSSGESRVAEACFAARAHSGRDFLSVNDAAAATDVVVVAGDFCLTQSFRLSAGHPKRCFHKNVVAAVFGPEAGRRPDWLGLLDPTFEAPRSRELGLRVLLRIERLP